MQGELRSTCIKLKMRTISEKPSSTGGIIERKKIQTDRLNQLLLSRFEVSSVVSCFVLVILSHVSLCTSLPALVFSYWFDCLLHLYECHLCLIISTSLIYLSVFFPCSPACSPAGLFTVLTLDSLFST